MGVLCASGNAFFLKKFAYMNKNLFLCTRILVKKVIINNLKVKRLCQKLKAK